MRMFAPRRFGQRVPRLDRDFAVGFRRQHVRMTSAASMALSIRASPLVGPSSVTSPLSAFEVFDFMLGVPRNAFAAIADIGHERSKRGKAFVEIWVIALDHRHRRHGLAGNRFTFALLPVFDVNRCASSPGVSWSVGVSTTSFSTPRYFRRDFGKRLGDAFENLPVASAFPERVHSA